MTTTFALEKYADNREITWIVAERAINGEWVGRGLSSMATIPDLMKAIEGIPNGELHIHEYAIFRNSSRIWEAKPRRYWRGVNVPVQLTSGLSGLVNSRQSDWF